MLQNRLFFALASRTGFGATISDAVVRSSVVFCNSVSADHIVMAASRLLRAVAAFVILLSFAARLGFGATISDAVVRSSIVFCNSVSADRLLAIFFGFCLLANSKAWQMQFLRFGIEIRCLKLVLYSLRQCMCSFSSARLCANCACFRRRCLVHARDEIDSVRKRSYIASMQRSYHI